MTQPQRDYVDVIYNEVDRPLTDYPSKLTRYLFDRYGMKPGQRLVDIGCGRGEFLRGFIKCGMQGFGLDRSRSAAKYCPEADLRTADLEKDSFPYEDDFFDVVYSKSVIEHFYYPEKLVSEIRRVLKPGGLVITMCPSWEHNHRIYFEDYTHRTPFMRDSLRDIKLIHAFDNVQVEYFRQLPVLWGAGRVLMPLAELTRVLTPHRISRITKWTRFSKEVMLLATATKPLLETT